MRHSLLLLRRLTCCDRRVLSEHHAARRHELGRCACSSVGRRRLLMRARRPPSGSLRRARCGQHFSSLRPPSHEQQRSDVDGWGRSAGRPRARPEALCSNALDDFDRTKCGVMLSTCPTRSARRRGRCETAVSVCRYVLKAVLGG